MNFQEAADKFSKFKSTGAPVLPGVKFKSRGKVFDLDFDLQLIDGSVAIIAKVAKEESEEPAKPQTPKRR